MGRQSRSTLAAMALSPAERISLIKKIAAALGEEPWTDLRLALSEFRVPEIEDAYGGGSYGYVIECMKGANDEAVEGLHAYLYPDVSVTPAIGAAGPWRENYFRLFLSHTHPHKDLAGGIRNFLLPRGVDSFVAHTAIEPTKEWRDEIESALATCDALAAIMTPDFIGSKWCDQEVGFCHGRGVLVLSVRQGADPHGFIDRWQALPGDTSDDASRNIAGRIYDTLLGNERTTQKMTPTIVHRFATSSSFDDARTNFQRLTQIPPDHWTDEMVEIAEKACEENRQIYEGNYYGTPIPDAVAAHLDTALDRVPADDDVPF